MNYETRTEKNGTIILTLGLHHQIEFEPDVGLEGIVLGVQEIIESVSGISSLDLIKAVMDEFAKGGIRLDEQPIS